VDPSPPTAHEHVPLDRQSADAPERSRRWPRIRAVLLFSIAALVVVADVPVWFFAGWASVGGDVGVPPTPSATDRVDLCAVLTLVAAAIGAATPVVALVIKLRRKRQAAQVVCAMAGFCLAIGVVGFAIGLSVIQNPGG